MKINIVKKNPQIGSTDIEAFEAEIGAKLPHDYRQFLLTSNGGKPESNQFDVAEARTNAGVNLFLGLLEEPHAGDLLYERSRMLDRIPKNVLSVGDASCGNLICLSLHSDIFGQVFFWDHELEAEEGEPATFANLFKAGNTFQEFFDSLRPFKSNEVQLNPGQVKKVWINPAFLKSVNEKKNDSTT